MSDPSSRHRRSLFGPLAAASVRHVLPQRTLLFQLLEPGLRSGAGHFDCLDGQKEASNAQRSFRMINNLYSR